MSNMRLAAVLLITLFLVSTCGFAQQTATNQQVTVLLQRAYSASSGPISISDATLNGTARRIAGSDDEAGTAVLMALAIGDSRAHYSLPSGQRIEIQNVSGDSPVGSWSGSDGVSHAISYHNLLTDPTWFFPTFVVGRALSGSPYVASYLGHETRNGLGVEHLTISQQFAGSSRITAMLQIVSQIELYLDSSTLLPTAMTFNMHPDNDMGLNLPIEIRFSDYRQINGALVPYHVQKFLNNSLVLDLQVETVSLNTGLSAGSFNVQ